MVISLCRDAEKAATAVRDSWVAGWEISLEPSSGELHATSVTHDVGDVE